MRLRFLTVVLFLAALPLFGQQNYTPTAENIISRKEFADAKFGIFLHWGLYSMVGDGEWVMHNKNINHKEYENLAGAFYPSKFSAAEWVGAIKKSGAKYICITSRHHDGFSLFDTAASDYNSVDATPFKRDILAEIAAECHKQGMRLHFYYSHLDWGREDYYPVGRTGRGTGRVGVLNGEKLPALDSAVFTTNYAWENYLKFMDTQLTELLTNYGPIGAIWFDGVWDRDKQQSGLEAKTWNLDNQYALIHKLQPSCLVGNNRHMDPFPGEDIQIFERDIPGQNLYGYSEQAISNVLPLETCQTMNRSWGYRLTDTTYKTADFLIKYLVQTAAKGANLLLNIGPRPDGTLPDKAIERLNAIGEWMEVYGETIYGTTAGLVPEQDWGVSTKKGHRNFLHIFELDADELFVPLENNEIEGCKDFATGEQIKFKRVKGGVELKIEGNPQVVEFWYKPYNEVAMREFVEGYMQKFPKATLQDIYKISFQDYFGPSHIMGSKEGVIKYLKREMESGEIGSGDYFTPCGWRNNYYQVNLSVIKDGLISLDEFADAFILGGGNEPELSNDWMQEWECLKRVVKEVAPKMVNYREDAVAIDNLLKGGNYVVHHSNLYENHYKPHYRIIKKEIFDLLILPKMK